MKTKLMLIGLMMCVVGAPLWADPVVAVTVSGRLVDQVIDLDEVGPEGWVALALQEPNSTTQEWEWVGPTVFVSGTPTERTNVRPAMYKTKDSSSITFDGYTMVDKRQSPAVPGDPTLWRTHSETSYVNNTYWKWTENSSTVEYKEYEFPDGLGDKRFRTYSAVAGPQQLLYDFIVTPVAVGAQHAVEAWFNLRLNGNTRYEFFVNDIKAGEYAPTNNPGNGYYQATLKIFPDSMDPLKVTVAFESMKPANTADRGGVFGAALKVSYTAVVVGQPVSQTVEIGSEAEFSITAGNATTYQWFKAPTTPVNNGTLASGAVISGAQTATLTITNVQPEEEGYYYCKVNNALEVPNDSEPARLLTKRLVGWWKLDNDPNDSVQDRYSAAPRFGGQTSGDPNYLTGVTGIDETAIQFTAKAGEIVNMPGSSAYYNFFPQGYTVSAWVKAPSTAAGIWRAFVSKMYGFGEETGSKHFGYALMHDLNGNAVFVQRRNMGNLGSNVQICDDTWHLVTGTWNPSDMIARVYVDGLLANQSGVQTQLPVLPPADSDPERSNVRIGADCDKTDGVLNSPFIGLVDDVRIYSYPLSASQVYYLYSELVPGAPTECVEFDEFDVTGPDGVPDCIVNLYDFAVFAEAWQECFIVPDCL